MDSEMYGDFSYSNCERSSMPVFLEKKKKDQDDILERLEEVSGKLDSLEESITNRIKQDVLPIMTESASRAVNDESKMEDIEELLSDVEKLKVDMREANWKKYPAKEVDELASDVKLLREERIKEKGELSARVVKLEEEIKDLKRELQLMVHNLGNLFTFVYGRDRGKSIQLKGGMQGDHLVIHTCRGPSREV